MCVPIAHVTIFSHFFGGEKAKFKEFAPRQFQNSKKGSELCLFLEYCSMIRILYI